MEKVEKLRFLAQHYNPYNPYQGTTLEEDHKIDQILLEFQLNGFDNPFDLTNRILKMLDEAEELLKLKH
jgi:hypothetical protein